MRSDSVAQGPLESSPQDAQKVDFAFKSSAELKRSIGLHCRIPPAQGELYWGGGLERSLQWDKRSIVSEAPAPLSLRTQEESREETL